MNGNLGETERASAHHGETLALGGAAGDASRWDGQLACICGTEKVGAVRTYLLQQFPGRLFRELHAPSRLMQAGVLAGHGDYHVVSMAADVPHHAVFLKEFWNDPVAAVEEHLQGWDLAWALRVHRIVILDKGKLYSL